MNSVEEVVESIEAAGLAVTLGQSPVVLDIETMQSGKQRFVLSPVLFRKNDEIPVEITVRDSDSSQRMVLMETRPSTLKQSTMVLFGEDERYFVAQVSDSATSVTDALERLVPPEVRVAQSEGLDVKRQGDWFFIPLTDEEVAQRWDNRGPYVPLCFSLGDHHVQKGVGLGDDILVRGDVTHSEHRTLHLSGWHQAVPNLAVRMPPSRDGWLTKRDWTMRGDWLAKRRD